MQKELCKILDTYNDFLAYWKNARFNDVKKQIELWQSSYMKEYPELLTKQLENYEESGVSWQDIAKKIFPLIPERFRLMQKARNNILSICSPICARASDKLGFDFNIFFVIYVGIGCGAG